MEVVCKDDDKVVKTHFIERVFEKIAISSSWNGACYVEQRRNRRAIMYASSGGLLWLLFLLFFSSGGSLLLLLFPSLKRSITRIFYVVAMWIIVFSLTQREEVQYVSMGFIYWVAGVSFIPVKQIKSPIVHLLVIASNGMVLLAFKTQFAFIFVFYCILRYTFSPPTMYDLGLCTLFVTLPIYVCLCAFCTIQVLKTIPPCIVPILLAPFVVFEDQFSKSISTSVVSSTGMILVYLIVTFN